MGAILYIIGIIIKFFFNIITHLIINSNKKIKKYTPQERFQFIENQRIRKGYKKGWLYYRCKEEGLLDEYYKHYKY